MKDIKIIEIESDFFKDLEVMPKMAKDGGRIKIDIAKPVYETSKKRIWFKRF